MNRICLFSLYLISFLFATSCKHQEKAVKTDQHVEYHDTHIGGNDQQDGMTAGKASEEETFVQGCIQKSLGNQGRALIEFQECLTMNPKSAAANYEIAGIFSQQGQSDRALKYAKAANDLSPENRWYKLRYAKILLDNNQFDLATKVFKELSDNEPSNTDLLFNYAASLKHSGKNEDALKVYDRIESIEGVSDTLETSRIVIYKANGDKVSEENALKALIKAFPEDIHHYYMLGDFYELTNNPAAGDFYIHMAEEFPGAVKPVLKSAAFQKKNNVEAFSLAKKAFLIPSDVDAKLEYLQSNYPITENAKALSTAEKTEADTLCAILRRVHEKDARAFSISGDYLFHEGKTKDAREYYHKAAALGQDEYAPWKRLMEINESLNDIAAQEKDTKQVMELFPTQPDAYFYLGMIEYNKKEYNKAIDNLESGRDFLQDNPKKDLEIKTILIDAYRQVGKTNKADNYSESVIEKDSSNIPLIVAYCQSMCDQRTKLFNAEQLMLYVIVKEPSNSNYYELLGWIEYQMHEYKVADQWMNRALQLSPNNPRINERIGDIEYQAGNKEMALAYWKKAKEKGGASQELENKIATKSMEEK